MPIEIQTVTETLLTYRNIGNYRKVIGIVTVPCKCVKWQVTVSTEASGEGRQNYSLVWSQRTPPRWGLLADFSVQSSASWHQLYLGRSEVLLSVCKSQLRSWNMQYPLPEKKASTVPFKLHALIQGTAEVGSHREDEDAWGTSESPRLSGQLGITHAGSRPLQLIVLGRDCSPVPTFSHGHQTRLLKQVLCAVLVPQMKPTAWCFRSPSAFFPICSVMFEGR